MIVGLCIVQMAGLTIHALDHLDVVRRTELRENQHHAFSIYRTIAETEPAARPATLNELHIPSNFTVVLSDRPDQKLHGTDIPMPLRVLEAARRTFLSRHPMDGAPGMPPPGMMPHGMPPPPGPDFGPDPDAGRRFEPPHDPRMNLAEELPPILHVAMLPPRLYPRRIIIGHPPQSRFYAISLLLPDEKCWLIVTFREQRASPFDSPTFLIAFLLMTVSGGALILWGTQRLISPVATLAQAAESLGRDVNAPPLPENGPTEISRAAIAFNTMAARIRRFVTDRTVMLTAIGHDLRTPITRLKLRAEFIEDDELRDKFLADLDEMENMVSATLAFGRDSASREPLVSLELSALLQTITDEASEGAPDFADQISFDAPAVPVRIKARSLALKRALTNLVMNAIKYGGGAHVILAAPYTVKRGAKDERWVKVVIEDSGPGLPPEDLERMFEPFVRAEQSRNRETGGTGLGLAIARSIVRAQGGDVRLENRREGGLRAIVTLLV
ncbi:two component sensor histidine kinase [Neoasaia chiangmaiensis NBRC 101099]|nr:two component sensor histidine kinase [Neoasaia chiangmaiensis NBRC 101099]